MKKLFITLSLASILFACKDGDKKESTVEATEKQEVAATPNGASSFKLDAANSVIGWEGSAMMHKHNGTIKATEGSISVDDKNNITAGNFVFDINSLVSADLEKVADKKAKLEGHLKSADFFDAAKFATAKFEITKSTPTTDANGNTHLIYGNLTLKDSTKNIAFPAKVTINGSNLAATASFNINRLDFGMVYGNDEKLKVKDAFIKPEVAISLDIKANK